MRIDSAQSALHRARQLTPFHAEKRALDIVRMQALDTLDRVPLARAPRLEPAAVYICARKARLGPLTPLTKHLGRRGQHWWLEARRGSEVISLGRRRIRDVDRAGRIRLTPNLLKVGIADHSREPEGSFTRVRISKRFQFVNEDKLFDVLQHTRDNLVPGHVEATWLPVLQDCQSWVQDMAMRTRPKVTWAFAPKCSVGTLARAVIGKRLGQIRERAAQPLRKLGGQRFNYPVPPAPSPSEILSAPKRPPVSCRGA